ncbi:TlpA family protein disulfide reductase [Halosquirtibacter xylanolyticus]|uniref:TlpA family protein disulfide reductase n=1 Tax=Halosquirtibacter xylanolyticus TaxID=3374599 RepID=UPI0037493011|nr:TlpA family protein disulfide reductase [Prolixibacteraceae bacterium]
MMLKTLLGYTYISVVLLLSSCSKPSQRDYALLTIKSTDSTLTQLQIRYGRKDFKLLTKTKDDVFTDTIRFSNLDVGGILLKGKPGVIFLYTRHGSDMVMEINGSKFIDAIFTKDLQKENQFLIDARIELRTLKDDFDKIQNLQQAQQVLDEFVDKYVVKAKKKSKDPVYKLLVKREVTNAARNAIIYPFKKKEHLRLTKKWDLSEGKPAPKFIDYENLHGGTTSLDDLKGKYVYLEFSTINCGPCRKELPYLKSIVRKYQHQNIAFVNINYNRKEDHDWWKEVMSKKDFPVIQLFANGDRYLMHAYEKMGVPSFVLIDPQGNIVNANPPRPSNPKLVKLLDALL